VSDQRIGWTYQEVIRRAGAIAGVLAELGIRGQPVVLFLPRSAEGIVSIAGTLMSGNFYVPLDVSAPAARNQAILDRLSGGCVLTSSQYCTGLPAGVTRDRTILIDRIWGKELPAFGDALAAARAAVERVLDCDPVYVMHTSGSTGIPKGVTIAHRGVIDYISWAADLFALSPSDVLGNQAPLFFDNSTLDIYLSWACGSGLYVIPSDSLAFPGALVRDLAARHVSFVFFVPSVLVAVARCNALVGQSLSELKTVAFAGEVMPAKHLRYWQDHHPHCKYVNLYGPTETTVDCTYFVVDRPVSPEQAVPIGWARRNMQVLVLDDQGRPAADGEVGELHVRGSALALGYWGDNEATAARFVPNPMTGSHGDVLYRTGDLGYVNPDGQLVFVGRRDSQIKHLGHRIELEEIELAAIRLHGIANACALYDSEAGEIVLVYESATDLCVEDVTSGLTDSLPRYMIPRRLVRRDTLPRTPNGKMDRRGLERELVAALGRGPA
jgi:amino acid adenylation domain-containing protein